MDERKLGPDVNPTGKKMNRRSLIKKGLGLGSLAYVAPMVVGSVAKVSAQGPSGATCPTLDTCTTFSCGAAGCACVPTIEGGRACVSPTCTAVSCVSSAACGSGQVCFTLGCCGAGNFCVPVCGVVATPNVRWSPAG